MHNTILCHFLNFLGNGGFASLLSSSTKLDHGLWLEKVHPFCWDFKDILKLVYLFIYLLPLHSVIDFFVICDVMIVCEINFIIYIGLKVFLKFILLLYYVATLMN